MIPGKKKKYIFDVPFARLYNNIFNGSRYILNEFFQYETDIFEKKYNILID